MVPRRPARVLIVDDEPAIVELLHEILSTDEYDVRPVGDSADAVAVALAFQPHVLLLDLVMPGLQGQEVLRVLREHGVQAPGGGAIAARPELAGPEFFDVLGKPLELQEVLRVVADATRFGRPPDDP